MASASPDRGKKCSVRLVGNKRTLEVALDDGFHYTYDGSTYTCGPSGPATLTSTASVATTTVMDQQQKHLAKELSTKPLAAFLCLDKQVRRLTDMIPANITVKQPAVVRKALCGLYVVCHRFDAIDGKGHGDYQMMVFRDQCPSMAWGGVFPQVNATRYEKLMHLLSHKAYEWSIDNLQTITFTFELKTQTAAASGSSATTSASGASATAMASRQTATATAATRTVAAGNGAEGGSGIETVTLKLEAMQGTFQESYAPGQFASLLALINKQTAYVSNLDTDGASFESLRAEALVRWRALRSAKEEANFNEAEIDALPGEFLRALLERFKGAKEQDTEATETKQLLDLLTRSKRAKTS